MVTGALIGSGIGIIGAALEAGTITGGTAVTYGAIVGAGGGVLGNTAQQLKEGKSLANIDPKEQAIAGLVGAAFGAASGTTEVIKDVAQAGVREIQAAGARQMVACETSLLAEDAGISIVNRVNNDIMAGMAKTQSALSLSNGIITAADTLVTPFVEHAAKDIAIRASEASTR
jgi:hypothetical protein